MRLNASFGLTVAVIGLGAVWGCADGRNQLSPVSPSTLSSSPSSAGRGVSRTPLQRVDNDGDGYDDPEPPGDAPPPVPDPGQIPPAVQLTVNIASSFGTGAFAPNPLQAATGNTIVWLNADLINHDIVLDDGTPVGNLAPGQSSLPLAVVAPVTYHCALHPTEVGQVTIAQPVQLTVNITGSFGTGAFAPNPLQAATGNTIVWLNADVITHAIVLDPSRKSRARSIEPSAGTRQPGDRLSLHASSNDGRTDHHRGARGTAARPRIRTAIHRPS
jgi:plastocyanin